MGFETLTIGRTGSLVITRQIGLSSGEIDGNPNALIRKCVWNSPMNIKYGNSFVWIDASKKMDPTSIQGEFGG